ncbi:MAG: DinB family protein [Candidatus Eisenbacteria bacterium]
MERPNADLKDRFLEVYETEHERTMRVLRAYPVEQLDLRPHEKLKTARELAWVFVGERRLGVKVWSDAFAHAAPAGKAPLVPDSWEELLDTLEAAHAEFREVVRATPEEQLVEKVHFFVAPKTMGEIRRIDWAWFLLHDQIHHRGQFSVYLRMAGGKVPSIYGPTADEPWI